MSAFQNKNTKKSRDNCMFPFSSIFFALPYVALRQIFSIEYIYIYKLNQFYFKKCNTNQKIKTYRFYHKVQHVEQPVKDNNIQKRHEISKFELPTSQNVIKQTPKKKKKDFKHLYLNIGQAFGRFHTKKIEYLRIRTQPYIRYKLHKNA